MGSPYIVHTVVILDFYKLSQIYKEMMSGSALYIIINEYLNLGAVFGGCKKMDEF